MNKAQLDVLERVFEQEIIGGIYQPKKESKALLMLLADNYIDRIEFTERANNKYNFSMTVRGFVLNHKGRQAYCSSDRCKYAEEE